MILNDLLFNASEQILLRTGGEDSFVVLAGGAKGTKFCARLDVEPVIQLDETELSNDPRMQSVVRIAQPMAFDLDVNDVVQKVDTLVKYKVLKFENNESTVTVDFYVEQQI